MNRRKKEKSYIEQHAQKEKRISCIKTAEELSAILTDISGEEYSPEEWLKRVYQYCVADFFPQNFNTDSWKMEIKKACEYYLGILTQLLEQERKCCSFDRCMDFELLTEDEMKNSAIKKEYQKFCEVIKDTKLYEFMRIARECTPFDTLGHVAGVHFTAMHIARQLAEHTSVQIDPGLISAAALIHDVGKFGCRPEEARRVPYLHYYYTQQFTDRYHIEDIGHVAANHSTWDLELENLSVENLLLIYADFRVKSVRENGKEQICFWSLDESYKIILSKLDNVDEKKAKRYEKVFMKLKDFEMFLEELGVSTDLDLAFGHKAVLKETVFMNQREMAERFRHKAVESNLLVMNTFSDAQSFTNLLEEANSEKDWRNVRSYLNVLDEYSGYLSCRQKETILKFLYEMLMNKDGDIRRQAASIMGKLIAQYEVRYQKEIPEGAAAFSQEKTDLMIWDSVLHLILVTDHKITNQHRRWIGYALKTVFHTVMEEISADKREKFLDVLLKFYNAQQWDDLATFVLADCAYDIPVDECTEQQRKILEQFMACVYKDSTYECKIAVLRFRKHWYGKTEEREFFSVNTENLIRLFQENQKMEIPWIKKLVNMEILNDYFRNNKKEDCFQLAAHLVNILQNSDRIVIRRQAGQYLTELMEDLTDAQRYEIAAELTKGLEIGQYSAGRYIPEYLGQIFYTLDRDAQEEMIGKLREMIDGKNHKIAIMALETVGRATQFVYSVSKEEISGESINRRKTQLEGLLLRGMAHYQAEVRQEAFYITGHSIFGSRELLLEEKAEYFVSMGKKILSLMKKECGVFQLYNNAAALNHIYRFILDYSIRYGAFPEKNIKRAAFFPGTFDPFSRGHKAVVEEIMKYDMEVYLAVDEFSWSKKTQPYKIRRRIVEMSVADLKNVYLFPGDIPVNIANPKSLKRLKETVKVQELFIVVGSDVVMNASAYKKKPQQDSVHQFAHIVLQRESKKTEDRNKIEERISGNILWLDIREKGENISSTRIRENIDKNRDISNLVEHNVQNYIYTNGLYVREPMYRQMTGSRAVKTSVFEQIPEELREELHWGLLNGDKEIPENESAVIIRNERAYERIEGVILYHQIYVSELYKECGNESAATWFRKHISGRICVLSQISCRPDNGYEDNRQAVFMETMADFVRKEVSYVLCRETEENKEFLERQGFRKVTDDWYLVDVRRPLLLFADMPLAMKHPFAENEEICNKVMKCRKKLQHALTGLYPGQLVLAMDSYIINYKLVTRIAGENKRSLFQMQQADWGEKMCVPFGKIMKGVQVPNTVTKELNTEKIYSSDMRQFVIKEYPDYADLEVQLRTIKAFERPVLLVDNLFHKSYRMDFIAPYLKKEEVPIDKILVSVMTGIGKDTAEIRGWDVECLYFVPNMRTWFFESDFYPFIGGDSIEKEKLDIPMLPSVNPILPYQIPAFLKGIKAASFYEVSKVCLENALEILSTLEKEYQKLSGRKLSLERLGEVLVQSRYPDLSTGAPYKMNEAPSVYLKYELERLQRMYAFSLYGREEEE